MKEKKKNKHIDEKNVDKYVMFGFNKNNPDETGYLAPCSRDNDITVVDDIKSAQVFFSENISGITGFGKPEQWLDFWNSDENNPYKFHLVKTSL